MDFFKKVEKFEKKIGFYDFFSKFTVLFSEHTPKEPSSSVFELNEFPMPTDSDITYVRDEGGDFSYYRVKENHPFAVFCKNFQKQIMKVGPQPVSEFYDDYDFICYYFDEKYPKTEKQTSYFKDEDLEEENYQIFSERKSSKKMENSKLFYSSPLIEEEEKEKVLAIVFEHMYGFYCYIKTIYSSNFIITDILEDIKKKPDPIISNFCSKFLDLIKSTTFFEHSSLINEKSNLLDEIINCKSLNEKHIEIYNEIKNKQNELEKLNKEIFNNNVF